MARVGTSFSPTYAGLAGGGLSGGKRLSVSVKKGAPIQSQVQKYKEMLARVKQQEAEAAKLGLLTEEQRKAAGIVTGLSNEEFSKRLELIRTQIQAQAKAKEVTAQQVITKPLTDREILETKMKQSLQPMSFEGEYPKGYAKAKMAQELIATQLMPTSVRGSTAFETLKARRIPELRGELPQPVEVESQKQLGGAIVTTSGIVQPVIRSSQEKLREQMRKDEIVRQIKAHDVQPVREGRIESSVKLFGKEVLGVYREWFGGVPEEWKASYEAAKIREPSLAEQLYAGQMGYTPAPTQRSVPSFSKFMTYPKPKTTAIAGAIAGTYFLGKYGGAVGKVLTSVPTLVATSIVSTFAVKKQYPTILSAGAEATAIAAPVGIAKLIGKGVQAIKVKRFEAKAPKRQRVPFLLMAERGEIVKQTLPKEVQPKAIKDIIPSRQKTAPDFFPEMFREEELIFDSGDHIYIRDELSIFTATRPSRKPPSKYWNLPTRRIQTRLTKEPPTVRKIIDTPAKPPKDTQLRFILPERELPLYRYIPPVRPRTFTERIAREVQKMPIFSQVVPMPPVLVKPKAEAPQLGKLPDVLKEYVTARKGIAGARFGYMPKVKEKREKEEIPKFTGGRKAITDFKYSIRARAPIGQDTATTERLSFIPDVTTDTKPTTDTRRDTKQEVPPIVIPIIEPIITPKIDITPKPKIPEPPPPYIQEPEMPKRKTRYAEKARMNLGYNSFVRERGRFVKVNKEPNPFNKAHNLARDYVDNSTAVTYKIARAMRGTTQQDDFSLNMPNKFQQKNGIFMELSRHRIDTINEKKGITLKGLMAMRRRGIVKGLIRKNKKKQAINMLKSSNMIRQSFFKKSGGGFL